MAGFFQQLMAEDGYPPELLFYKLTIGRVVGWTLCKLEASFRFKTFMVSNFAVGIGVLSLIGWATTPASGITEAPKKKKACIFLSSNQDC